MNADGDHPNFDDAWLDELLRMASKVEQEGFQRPSDGAIEAYIRGEADESQQAEVQDALIKSPDFRAEFLKRAGGLIEDNAGLEAAFDSARVPEVPDIEPFRLLKDIPAEPSYESKETISPWTRLVQLLSFRNWSVPAFAVRAVVVGGLVAILLRPGMEVPMFEMTTELDPGTPQSVLELNSSWRSPDTERFSLELHSNEVITLRLKLKLLSELNENARLAIVDMFGESIWLDPLRNVVAGQEELFLHVNTGKLEPGSYEVQLRDEFNAPIIGSFFSIERE